ncbi:hypothetical protein VaNZ11_013262, partial [Volvox africanus]
AMTRIVQYLPRAVTPRFRKAYHSVGTHPAGSKALDLLTGGGYPAGSIIEASESVILRSHASLAVPSEKTRGFTFRSKPIVSLCGSQIQGSDLKPCWQLAWLAAAAAYKRGWKVTACSAAACLDFGAERGLTARDKFARTSVAQPQALLDVVRSVERDCSLIMVDSWARIAEAAAAPAGPDSSAIRAMRNRRLAGFLRQLSSRLLLHKAQEDNIDNDNGCMIGARSQGYVSRNWPAPSVIVCSTGQKGHGSVLQHYATMRLRVSEHREYDTAEDGPGHMVVEMLKGPAVNTRMPITQTRVYLSSRTTDVLSFTDVQDPCAALDLLMGTEGLGLVRKMPCNVSSLKNSMSVAKQTAEHDVYA